LWSVILITSMQSISKFLHQNGALKKIDQITGSIFILFAVKLAFTNR
ncbi:LysE family translocator, partial [Acinetobacter johnsonii]